GGRRLARRSTGPERILVGINPDRILWVVVRASVSQHGFGDNAQGERRRSRGRQAKKRTPGRGRKTEIVVAGSHHEPRAGHLTAKVLVRGRLFCRRARNFVASPVLAPDGQ